MEFTLNSLDTGSLSIVSLLLLQESSKPGYPHRTGFPVSRKGNRTSGRTVPPHDSGLHELADWVETEKKTMMEDENKRNWITISIDFSLF